MEYLTYEGMSSRLVFSFLGFVCWSLKLLWQQKNQIDKLSNKTSRHKAWAAWRRKHWEDYVIGLIVSLILAVAAEPLVVVSDNFRNTEWRSSYLESVEGISFLIGFLWMILLAELFKRGRSHISKLDG